MKHQKGYTLLAIGVVCLFLAVHYSDVNQKSLWLGVPLLLLGLSIRLWTNACIVKSELVYDKGPYAICRHPMYVGTAVAAVGLAFVLNVPSYAAIIAAAIMINYARAAREQRRLESLFPDYATYKKRVPALPTPSSIARAIRSGDVFESLSLKRCYMNGEITRINFYWMLVSLVAVHLHFTGQMVLSPSTLLAFFFILLILVFLTYYARPRDVSVAKPVYALCGSIALGGLAFSTNALLS